MVRRFLAGFWTWLGDWPERVARYLALVVRGAHEPVPAPTGDRVQWPSGEMPWCPRCNVVWPCAPAVRMADLVDGDQR